MTRTTTQLETALSLFNPVLAETTLYNTRTAYSANNRHQLVHHATHALTEIQKYQLVSLLDICAHARGMKSKFELAIENAQEIIDYAPEWSIGYLRLGDLLDMQGKSLKSIEVYEDLLRNVSYQDDPAAYHQLIQLKNAAVKRSETRVDFIGLLPLELTSNILRRLPEVEKSTCFNVSTIWRQRMIDNGSTVWKDILNSDTRGFQTFPIAIKIANALPYIAQYVQNLTINARQKVILERYMEYFENEKFKKIKSFSLGAIAGSRMHRPNEGRVLLNALWQVKPTLTAVDIRFVRPGVNMTIADLLFCCPGLRKLVFYYSGPFDSILGSMEVLGEPRHKLVDVDFESQSFDGSLVKFLKYFPNIRRLSLKRGCVPENLDEIIEFCPNLEILGYYCYYDETDFKEQGYHQESYYNKPSSSRGITEIFTTENGYGAPAANFIRLVQKNANSLRRLHANMSMNVEQELAGEPFAHQYPVYPSWQFTQLEHLTYYSDIYRATETVFRQALESCTSLKELNMVDVSDLGKFVDTLVTLPPLESFSLSNILDADGGDQALIKLFKAYAKNHMSPVTTTRLSSLLPSQQRKKFSKFTCNYCADIITNDVLNALCELETIKVLTFSGTWTIPSETSLQNCLNKMSNQLVEITLIKIDYVDDNILEILSKMDQLETVYMKDLENISNTGVTDLVDNTKSLRNISLVDCHVSKLTLAYVEAKMKLLRT